jgi:hypothetical protein
MASTVLYSTLKRQAREMADAETSAPDEAHVDDTELLDRFNASLKIWHGKVVKAWPELYEAAPQVITADGSTGYALPSDYFATLGVDYKFDDDAYIALDRLMPAERNKYPGTGLAVAYRIKGSELALFPRPLDGEYRHLYVKTPTLFVDNGSSSVDGVNGWEQWMVLDVAIYMLNKAKIDSSEEQKERARIEREMEIASADRDLVTPMRVVDTRTQKGRVSDPDFWA